MFGFKKALAALFVGVTAFVLTGCGGKDMSGTYQADIGDKNEHARILEVEKGDKDGYTINYRVVGYDVKEEIGAGSTIPSPWAAGKVKAHSITDIEATWSDVVENTLITSAPNKNNKMTYKDTQNMGFLTGIIAIDEEGNLIDETGKITGPLGVKGTKFKKVKTLNIEELKKTFQEHVTANAHEEFEFSNSMKDSKVGKIEFKDSKK